MARYYCEYCHSYLTHDTLSVRKSHLVGKNHLRITADYYRNKQVEQDRKQRSVSNKKVRHVVREESRRKIVMHCLKNKEKKMTNKIQSAYKKELVARDVSDALKRVYYGSPGYSKVFINSNRFDIGELVQAAKLPRRANEKPSKRDTSVDNLHADMDRNHIYVRDERKRLEPPMILSQWNNTLPKQSVYNDSGKMLQNTIVESEKRIYETNVYDNYNRKKMRLK